MEMLRAEMPVYRVVAKKVQCMEAFPPSSKKVPNSFGGVLRLGTHFVAKAERRAPKLKAKVSPNG
eukprot:COSAG01_NODE_33108_length_570_cov_0.800425_2_plen_65_part_00